MQIEKFDEMTAGLQKLVQVSKLIIKVDVENKEEVEAVKINRKILSDARIEITRMGKEFREEANAFNKSVLKKEKELIEIIEPEETRLKFIEEEAKALKVTNQRVALLPERKKRIEEIINGTDLISIGDVGLLGFDEVEFQTYLNALVSERNARETSRIEQIKEAQRKESERLDWESKAQERAEMARKQDRENAEREKMDFRVKKVRELGLILDLSKNAYILEDFYVPFLDVQTWSDVEFAEMIVKIKGEQDARKEQDNILKERDRVGADERYQVWIKEIGYEVGSEDGKIVDMGEFLVFYKVVSKFKK